MIDYNDGKWHGWNGGECPLHPETEVLAVLFDETGATHFAGLHDDTSPFKAGDHPKIWAWGPAHRKIVAFRVTKEFREARDFWINSVAGRARILSEEPDQPHGYTHVREVVE